MTFINVNSNRLNHLLKLYRLSKEELLAKLNEKRKRALTEEDVFGSLIKISVLKKIDQLFNKGLSYYIDPKNLKKNKEESIFFRKDKFNAELSFGAKQIVTKYEEEKITFSALSKLSDFKVERVLPVFTLKSNPKKVAKEIRETLYPDFDKNRKMFLKSLINSLANNNILVFEFVENWNKKEKANINGFYLSPNVIVLKRQKSTSREIFTLIHELGHYLLDSEEIDENIGYDYSTYKSPEKIEKWCNDFAYFFLIGNLDSTITKLDKANSKNDYHHDLIEEISEQTNLSRFALFTRLRINGQISYNDYQSVKSNFEEQFRKKEEELKRQRELDRQEGRRIFARAAKPIISPLYKNVVQSAYIEGVIGESEFCRRLNVKPENINKYL